MPNTQNGERLLPHAAATCKKTCHEEQNNALLIDDTNKKAIPDHHKGTQGTNRKPHSETRGAACMNHHVLPYHTGASRVGSFLSLACPSADPLVVVLAVIALQLCEEKGAHEVRRPPVRIRFAQLDGRGGVLKSERRG